MLDTYMIILVVVLALIFDFINGFHDTANAIATCVSTRAIRPGLAIIGTAILNFIGAMISTGVAKTIGGDIVISASMINELIIVSGLTGAIIWNLLTWYIGMPSSSSHALIGGMIGAVAISVGFGALNGWGMTFFCQSIGDAGIAVNCRVIDGNGRRQDNEIEEIRRRRKAHIGENLDERAVLRANLIPRPEAHDDDHRTDVEDENAPDNLIDCLGQGAFGIFCFSCGDTD